MKELTTIMKGQIDIAKQFDRKHVTFSTKEPLSGSEKKQIERATGTKLTQKQNGGYKLSWK